MKPLIHSSMLLYFTNRAPSVISVKNWVEDEFQNQNDWPVAQLKLIGNNFFMIAFTRAEDRDVTLKATPWFIFKIFVFAMAWNPDFNVHKYFCTKIPTWT